MCARVESIFSRPMVKAAVIGILTAIFGVLCNWTVGTGVLLRWIIFIAFSIFNIVILCLYANAEKSTSQKIAELEGQLTVIKREEADLVFTNEAFSSAMQGIAAVCKYSSQNANIQIHEIIERMRIDCKAWNFDLASDTVCAALYDNVIQKLGIPKANDGIVDVEVAYVKLIEDGSGTQEKMTEKHISLCGYHHPTRSGPTIRGKSRLVEKDAYHDASLFLSASDQLDIQPDASAVCSVFKNGDGKDYSQYLGIPVFCLTQRKTSKMVGLLQIVCHGDSILAKSANEIKTLANTFFIPYAYLLLLLYKMDKALRAQPRIGGD